MWTQARGRVTCSRERNMLLRGCWKEDSISSVYEEEAGGKKWESERVRRGNRKKQMEGGQKVRRRKRERERRGVKVLYGVLNGSCIQAAVISGHPLWCAHLYTCDFHSKYSRKKTRKFSANNRLCRPVTMTCCSTRWRDSFRQSAVNSQCSLTCLTYPTVQLPQSSID